MPELQEQYRVGLDSLEAATALLQRIRHSHPTSGLYEAADLQWWWRVPRPKTDESPQLFWIDPLGRPEAAVIATDWGDEVSLDPHVMPDATPNWVAHVVARGLAHARARGFDTISLEVDGADDALQEVLVGHGLALEEGGLVEAWLDAAARPGISPLHAGYRLFRRSDTGSHPHHMSERSGPDVERRLQQTSLYRPDLDLVVHDSRGSVAAYGLFWFDPETATGLVEPMRTLEGHQRCGLARHVLTSGIGRLTDAGAERIKICYQPANQPAADLYSSTGFAPHRRTVVFTRRASTDTPLAPAGPGRERGVQST